MNYLLGLAGVGFGAALLAACHSDQPAAADTTTAAAVAAQSKVPAFTPPSGPLRSGDAERNTDHDTLRVAGGGVLYLKPSTAAAFARLPEQLPGYPDSTLTAAGRVRRQADDLVLQPDQGPLVRLPTIRAGLNSPDDPTQRAIPRYRGVLPTAALWVVETEHMDNTATTLINQRTGRRTEVVGRPAVSPDGRYLISVKSDQGNDGSGTDATGIQLYRLGTGAPRLLWTREPVNWGATQARWTGPRTVLLEQDRAAPSQEDEAPAPTYVEVTLPDLR